MQSQMQAPGELELRGNLGSHRAQGDLVSIFAPKPAAIVSQMWLSVSSEKDS